MAKERFRRTDYSITTNITFLSKFDFDTAVANKIHYKSKNYRLVRDHYNAFDTNAIYIFIDQLCVGYLPREIAKIVAPRMDEGDIFSIVFRFASKGDSYNPKFDNEYSDGYFRELHISIYNESEIARVRGKEIDPDLLASLSHQNNNPPKRPNKKPKFKTVDQNPTSTGCGCMMILLAGTLITSLLWVFASILF